MGTNLINVKTFGFFVSLFIIKIVFEYYYTFSNFNAYKILELILFYQIQYIRVQFLSCVLAEIWLSIHISVLLFATLPSS